MEYTLGGVLIPEIREGYPSSSTQKNRWGGIWGTLPCSNCDPFLEKIGKWVKPT